VILSVALNRKSKLTLERGTNTTNRNTRASTVKVCIATANCDCDCPRSILFASSKPADGSWSLWVESSEQLMTVHFKGYNCAHHYCLSRGGAGQGSMGLNPSRDQSDR